MKSLTFALLALTLVVGCENPRINNVVATRTNQEMIPERVYTISCEGTTGWTKYQTKRHPSNAYGGRSGVWSFLTIEGDSVWATNCLATIEAE